MAITTRAELIDYCRRRLGEPVIHLELEETQVEDRIDDAIEFFQEVHYEGTERIYLKHQVTQDDKTNMWVPIPEEIIGLSKVLPFKNNISSTNYIDYAFDPKYQLTVTELYNIASASFVYFEQLQQHLSMLDYVLRPIDSVEFNRRTGRVYLNINWNKMEVGDYLIFECFRAVDPQTFPKVYNERLLKEYSTALIKLQWGTNLKKFEGVQMIGGITLNGQQIFNEAQEEVRLLEEKIRSQFELPPIGFFE